MRPSTESLRTRVPSESQLDSNMEAPHNLEKRDDLLHPIEGGALHIATPGATSDRSSVDPETSDNLDLEKEQSRRDFGDRQPADDVERQQPPPEEQQTREEKDPNLVEWDGPDDPENPMNWPTRKKWVSTMALACLTFTITFASAVFSTATQVTAIEFGVSGEVMILGTSLFVLGFALGPLVSSTRTTTFPPFSIKCLVRSGAPFPSSSAASSPCSSATRSSPSSRSPSR